MADLDALIIDWGGVLTSSLNEAMRSWCVDEGIDYVEFRKVMKDWLSTSHGEAVTSNPIHALERGEIEVPAFERELAAILSSRVGRGIEAPGLLARMFSGFSPELPMLHAMRRAKGAGLATALLSNSWGNEYPREGWEEMFDVVVISGEVGMRKPELAIYRLVADRLEVEPARCAFVDDLMPNIRAATEVGMVGVHHVSAEQTLDELEALFELDLRD